MEIDLDRVLATAANVRPPAGLEKRILAKLEARKVRSRRRARVASVLVAAGLCSAVILRAPQPVVSVATDSLTGPSVAAEPLPAVGAVYDRPRCHNCGTVGGHRPPLQVSGTVGGHRPPLQVSEVRAAKPRLIDDIDIRPLTVPALQISSLSDSQ